MSTIQRENFINIQGFMVTDLGLSGDELLIYAIIYGFSQMEGTYYTADLEYLANWITDTELIVISLLESLESQGLLEIVIKSKNGVKQYDCRAIY